jgi:hypothetical protein
MGISNGKNFIANIYWYIKQTTQDNDFLLYAYAVWDAGLASAVISLLLF